MIPLYLDEDALNVVLAQGLATRGIDVSTVTIAGMRRRSDAEQLEFASSQGRAIFSFSFSFNVAHFLGLHAAYMRAGKHHAGFILVRQRRYTPSEMLRRLTRLATALNPDEMIDRVEFLNDWG